MPCQFKNCKETTSENTCHVCGNPAHISCFSTNTALNSIPSFLVNVTTCGYPCLESYLKVKINIVTDNEEINLINNIFLTINKATESVYTNNTNKGKRIHRYAIRHKQEILTVISSNNMSIAHASKSFNIPKSTLFGWVYNRPSLFDPDLNENRFKSPGSGRKSSIPFEKELYEFLEASREQGKSLGTQQMMDFINKNYPAFVEEYKKKNTSPHKSMQRLCFRFAKKHGFDFSTNIILSTIPRNH